MAPFQQTADLANGADRLLGPIYIYKLDAS